MPILQAIEKHEKLFSKIKETIVPLQKEKLWNDDKFFDEVERLLAAELNEERISKAVADALFNLKESQPKVEYVKKIIEAFPDSLKCKNEKDRLPIEQLTFYPSQDQGKWGAKYITTLALEGLKHNVGGNNMRGGLLSVTNQKNTLQQRNTLQRLSKAGPDVLYLETLKDLRHHKLLLKEDIVDSKLLAFSCVGKFSLERFKYFLEWDPEALLDKAHGMSFMHLLVKYKEGSAEKLSNKASFKRCLQYSIKHYLHLLFLKDSKDKTALEQAIVKFGEEGTMTILKDVFTKDEAPYPILHEVIVHEPKYYNLFLQWFPDMFYLRDRNGRTPTQVMFSMNREFLNANPTFWINQTTDQLEEKDPKTTLRPFASVAYGILGDLNLSYQILRKHPSVIDVILEQREDAVDANNNRKRSAEDDLDHDNKKPKDEERAEVTV
ncbi:hypothetical protein CTEN210_13668 [Chaetoceros tenuissimus]|uniref:Uncharacterized protein n=1 Tax=Chaetoceros tenuissimus TaxID=426638 RepID=A0AAD3D3G0_9STRA|nr:hypothetical protein CTEN210_13668 [Chaetoceros tenuissimus]